jgi:hypothetical protein
LIFSTMKVATRLALPLLALLLTGCWFQNPLTPTGSESLNTWFLGEWRHKDKRGVVTRAVVSPIASDRYRVQATQGGKQYEFEAWTSRVGNSVFLTMCSLRNSPNLPEGAHLFAHSQMLDQNSIRLRPLRLDSPADASSFQLRKEIRARLKDGSLYAEGEHTDWERIGEVYWSKDGQAGVFAPLRYEVPKPGEKRTQAGVEIR